MNAGEDFDDMMELSKYKGKVDIIKRLFGTRLDGMLQVMKDTLRYCYKACDYGDYHGIYDTLMRYALYFQNIDDILKKLSGDDTFSLVELFEACDYSFDDKYVCSRFLEILHDVMACERLGIHKYGQGLKENTRLMRILGVNL